MVNAGLLRIIICTVARAEWAFEERSDEEVKEKLSVGLAPGDR